MKKTKQKNKVRISQCLIVKNEEKNIARALSWGKDIMMEQIVVDTGSTDRTVEIAEQMGARVYHYEWTNDFAAAKNYALEQASGTWIAFLDADEYLRKEDTEKLVSFLEQTEQAGKANGKHYQILRCQMANLNDSMEVFSVFMQDRFFVNDPALRYSGAIHENLIRSDGKKITCCNIQDNLTIYHTGYSHTAYQETRKVERNVTIMRGILEEEPENYNMMGYLADSLASGDQLEEALEYDRRVVEHREGVLVGRLVSCYGRLIRDLAFKKRREDEAELMNLYQGAVEVCPAFPDYDYYLGIWAISLNQWKEAAHYFSTALKKGDQYKEDYVCFINGNLPMVCYWTALAESHLENAQQTVTYSVLALRQDHYHENALKLLLQTFSKAGTKTEEIVAFLSKIYDYHSLKDRLFLIKAAKIAGLYQLSGCFYAMLSEEEQEELKAGDKKGLNRQELPVSIEAVNSIDTLFTLLMEQANGSEKDALLACMKDALYLMKEKQAANYEKLLAYVNGHHERCGRLVPEEEDYQAFELRINQLSDYMEKYLWVYRRLGDYRSKKTLLAILSNWLYLNTSMAAEVRENGPAYFDLDLISETGGTVYADMGAGSGAALYSYIQNYGENYKAIHCFESDLEMLGQLKQAARNLKNIQFHTEKGVSLDEAVSEKVAFIRIPPQEMLLDVLEGCTKTIQTARPSLAVDVSGQYGHIWQAAEFIDKLSSYRFYLRHYGGNLIPEGYLLYAIPA